MDPILYWNDVALEANRVSHTNGEKEQTGPTLSSRALAIVHLAVYDAFVGASQAALDHYLTPKPASGSSVGAAVAAAAHATLSKLFPSQRQFFDRKHTEAGISGTQLKRGHRFGLMVARNILADRKDDPGAGDDGHAVSMARGAHRPDPDKPDQGYHAPFYGAGSRCFAVTARHELDDPPRLADPEYRRALREVRRKGVAPELMGSVPPDPDFEHRKVDETVSGPTGATTGPRAPVRRRACTTRSCGKSPSRRATPRSRTPGCSRW